MVERSEFKGKPILVLKRTAEDRFPFFIGPSKAKLVVENYEALKAFVDETKETK